MKFLCSHSKFIQTEVSLSCTMMKLYRWKYSLNKFRNPRQEFDNPSILFCIIQPIQVCPFFSCYKFEKKVISKRSIQFYFSPTITRGLNTSWTYRSISALDSCTILMDCWCTDENIACVDSVMRLDSLGLRKVWGSFDCGSPLGGVCCSSELSPLLSF